MLRGDEDGFDDATSQATLCTCSLSFPQHINGVLASSTFRHPFANRKMSSAQVIAQES